MRDARGVEVTIGTTVRIVKGDNAIPSGALGRILKFSDDRAMVSDSKSGDIVNQTDWTWAGWLKSEEFEA